MTIIFNEEKAIQKRKEIRKQVQKENFLRKTKSITIAVLISLFFTALIIAIFYSQNNMNLKGLIFAIGIFLLMLIPSLREVFFEDVAKTIFPSTVYTPDIRYLIATKGKTVQNIDVNRGNNFIDLLLVSKNESEKISKERIYGFSKKVRNDIKDVVIDFEKAIIYIPAVTAN